MIPPLQQTATQFAFDTMQSMLDSMEEKRREELREQNETPEPDPLLEARITLSKEAERSRGKIVEALFNQSNVSTNELKIQLIDALGKELGLDRLDFDTPYAFARAVADNIEDLSDEMIDEIETKLGLDDLGISLSVLAEAIMFPFGNANERLMTALDKQANGGSGSDTELQRVLQRLDHAADPRTAEELKLEEQFWDPTRVVDDQSRAERVEDLKALDVSGKLADVQEMQDAIEARNDQTVKADGETGQIDETAALQMLAFVFETVQAVGESEVPETAPTDEPDIGDASTAPPDELDALSSEQVANTEALLLAPDAEEAQESLLTVEVDDEGLYWLLFPERAA
ncbi:hypothetical protein M8R20_16995 [Pseudomonas sp. R2.Fl]|nr:hypothetical protein [Pseudomonas sp. R2.Fl]